MRCVVISRVWDVVSSRELGIEEEEEVVRV
jgi:hypothetical protein